MAISFSSAMSGLSNVVSGVSNFAGSFLRNSFVMASNILPDGGALGWVGDTLGNALHIGGSGSAGAPYSGGGSGGSFLNPIGLSLTKGTPAASLDFSKLWSPVGDFGMGAPLGPAAKPERLAGVDSPESSAAQKVAPAASSTPQPEGAGSAAGGGSAAIQDDAANVPDPAAGLAVAIEPTVKFTPRITAGLKGKELADAIRENTDGALAASQGKNLDYAAYSLLNQDADKIYENLEQAVGPDGNVVDEAKLTAAARRSNGLVGYAMSESAVEADMRLNYNTLVSEHTRLQESMPLAGPALESEAGKRHVAKVRRYETEKRALEARAPTMSQAALSAEVKRLSERVTALADERERLGGTIHTSWLTRVNGFGEDLGLDTAALGVWLQYLTPVALAGLAYYTQNKADEKNRKYMEKVRQEDRAEAARLQTERLNAQIRMAGMSHSADSPAAVGPSRSHTIGGGVNSA